MEFNSKAGQELRTWILFFVGIGLAIVFALNKNPLNPWWTLIIGAFTCTAIVVSAVTTLTGGISDAVRKSVEEAQRDGTDNNPKENSKSPLSITVGPHSFGFIRNLRRRHTTPI